MYKIGKIIRPDSTDVYIVGSKQTWCSNLCPCFECSNKCCMDDRNVPNENELLYVATDADAMLDFHKWFEVRNFVHAQKNSLRSIEEIMIDFLELLGDLDV